MDGMGLFPYKTMRHGQEEIIQDMSLALAKGRSVISYFPPGVGKTTAVLSAAIDVSQTKGKRIFFLTGRKSQHKATVEILRKIAEKEKGLTVVDLPTPRNVCPNSESKSSHMGCICSKMGRCKSGNFDLEIYRKIKSNILNYEETVQECLDKDICPLEMALNAAQEADVILCDYRYIFTEEGEWFVESSQLNYKDSILVIDESHRLPDQIKSSLNISLTKDVIQGAIQEAEGRRQKNLVYYLNGVGSIIEALSDRLEEREEVEIEREVFVKCLKQMLRKRNYGRLTLDEFMESLQLLDATLRKQKGYTNTYRVLRFIKQWTFPTGPMVGILRMGNEPKLILNCLDPSVISKGIFTKIQSAVLMSNTPMPPEMYADILGIPSKTLLDKSYGTYNPNNTLTILSDKRITTSNSDRSPDMYSAIAKEIVAISSKVPGNLAVFFPSYTVLRSSHQFLQELGPRKKVYVEEYGQSRGNKKKMAEEMEAGNGGILLGVQGGYFSDSPEFKKNLFSGIVVVGIPFSKPDVEQKATMEYLKSRFGGMKGYYYSQIYPAMSKVVQAMSNNPGGDKKDKGVCVLMDYRFKDPKFLKALPSEYQVDVEQDVGMRLDEIFNNGFEGGLEDGGP